VRRGWRVVTCSRPTGQIPRPAHGQRETSEQRQARERDEKEWKKDKTKYNISNESALRELLKVHFETCMSKAWGGTSRLVGKSSVHARARHPLALASDPQDKVPSIIPTISSPSF
jgi:hypothetical protein